MRVAFGTRSRRTCFLATFVASFVMFVALFRKFKHDGTVSLNIHSSAILTTVSHNETVPTVTRSSIAITVTQSNYSTNSPVSPQTVSLHQNGEQSGETLSASVVILGDINTNKSYAVFSTTSANKDSISFIFYLPLTTLAWKRIGFESVIIIVGSLEDWNSNKIYQFVLSNVRQLGAVVVFLKSRPENAVMMSQVSRIFVASILQSRTSLANHQQSLIDKVYLITSDSDIWPLDNDIYRLPKTKDILSLNSDCCKRFTHRGSSYKMLPMSNMGMTFGTWKIMTKRFGSWPTSPEDIVQYFVNEFGDFVRRPVKKGENAGWFMDQRMLSVLVATLTKNSTNISIAFIPRNTRKDRIDRKSWNPAKGIRDRVDAHLLTNAYIARAWNQLVPLLSAMYGNETERYRWCVRYHETFQRILFTHQ